MCGYSCVVSSSAAAVLMLPAGCFAASSSGGVGLATGVPLVSVACLELHMPILAAQLFCCCFAADAAVADGAVAAGHVAPPLWCSC